MKPRHLFMALGLATTGWLAFFGDKSAHNDIAEPVVHERPVRQSNSAPSKAVANSDRKDKHAPVILALRPRAELIGEVHDTAQPETLFASQSWSPPAPPPLPPVSPPPPPSAPPLPFTYLGKKFEGGQWEVYLSHGEQLYVAREKSTIEGVYQVESITPPTLSLIYLPLKQQQTISIGGLD